MKFTSRYRIWSVNAVLRNNMEETSQDSSETEQEAGQKEIIYSEYQEESFLQESPKLEVAVPEKEGFEDNCESHVIMVVQSCNPVTALATPCKSTRSTRLSSSGQVCRICHEDDCNEGLISPCECAGSLGRVHISCLEKWLSASNSTQCEICRHQLEANRYPRPPWQWFHRAGHGLYSDLLCLLVLTPLCLASIYLCGVGAAVYMHHGIWEATGLAMLCCFLLATFLLWVIVTIRFHWKMLRRWQLMNPVIRLDMRNHHCRDIQPNQDSEVNNNANITRQSSSSSQQDIELNVFV